MPRTLTEVRAECNLVYSAEQQRRDTLQWAEMTSLLKLRLKLVRSTTGISLRIFGVVYPSWKLAIAVLGHSRSWLRRRVE